MMMCAGAVRLFSVAEAMRYCWAVCQVDVALENTSFVALGITFLSISRWLWW